MTGNSSYRLVAELGKAEILETAIFNAPREFVFKTMTDPKLIPRWWGPKSLTTTVDKDESKPGGVWRYVQRDSEGNEYAFNGIYQEITPPERLVLTFNYEGTPDHEAVVTTIFEEQDGKTMVTSKTIFQSVEDRDQMVQSGMEAGARETMDRFAELLEGIQLGKSEAASLGKKDNELVITRVFDAPRELVWKAWNSCEIMKQWWGPKGYTSTYCRNDFRVGGTSLSNMQAPEGNDPWSGKTIWSTGIYKEIVPFQKIVTTDSFSDEQGNVVSAARYGMNADFPLELLVTVRFEDYEGKIRLTLQHTGFPSEADCDGAREGWNESLDKLAVVLIKLKKEPIVAESTAA